MVRSKQSRALRPLGFAGGVLLVSVLLVGAFALHAGSGAPLSTVLVVPLLVGALLMLIALLLAERTGDTPGETLEATSCVACDRPIIEEWRLCPHCGQLRECDLTLEAKGGSTRG